MKPTIVFFLATAVLFCSCVNTQNRIAGSGLNVIRTITLGSFDRVDASRGVNLTLISDTTANAMATIEADDNVIDNVIVEVHDGELTVSITPSITFFTYHKINVTVPTDGRIKALKASSAANIKSHVHLIHSELELEAANASVIDIRATVGRCHAEALNASQIMLEIAGDSIQPTQELKLEASNASTITANVSIAKCDAEASTASTIKLTGLVDAFSAEITSASKLRALKFTAANADIEASSASKASVNCTDYLRASASSGASITYAGNCRTELHGSSGGRINKH